MVTDRQVRRLFEVHAVTGKVGLSALKAGMCPPTGAKYIQAAKLPSEMRKAHDWPTRLDPFAEAEEELNGMLEVMPNLPATMAHCRLQ